MMDIEAVKKNLIQRIKKTENEKLLLVIEEFLKSESFKEEEIIHFSPEQEELLKLGEQDIKYGRVINEEDLDNSDAEWMS